MELMTENMENLTQEMHSIAKQTREETISMRIMALIALMFLPGTFASVRRVACSPTSSQLILRQTLMTTKIFQASNPAEYEEARNQFLMISLPLLFGMVLSWYIAKEWYKYVNKGKTAIQTK